MAKQNSIVKIRGTVDDLTFRETKDGHQVMKKTRSITKERIASDPKFARLRENMSEFQRGISAGKLMRMAAQDILANCSDKRVATRLTSEMMKVLIADSVSRRGQRNVMDGDVTLLKDFNFNPPADLSQALKVGFSSRIERASGKLSVEIPSLIPEESVSCPVGATHFKFHAAGIEINFGTQVFISKAEESAAMSVGSEAVPSVSLNLALTPDSTNPLFLLLGIKFYQEVNGSFYLLKSGTYNAISIVNAENAH